MKLHQIRDMIAVAEKGSLRAASRHLGLAQSAITRSIRQLEWELGVPLFERRKRGTVLTPMGALFLRRARSAVSELSRAREEIQQHQGGAEGTVVVCLSSVPHIALLPKALAPFRARYPAVRLRVIEEVVYPHVEGRLKDGSIDFYAGIVPGDGPGPELVMEKLFDNTRVVMARNDHPLGGCRSLSDLTDAEWIAAGHNAESDLEKIFKRHRLLPPRHIATADSLLSALVLTAYTDALAILPRQWKDFPPARAVLQEVPVKEIIPALPIAIVRRSNMPLTPAAEYFCELLRKSAFQLRRDQSLLPIQQPA